MATRALTIAAQRYAMAARNTVQIKEEEPYSGSQSSAVCDENSILEQEFLRDMEELGALEHCNDIGLVQNGHIPSLRSNDTAGWSGQQRARVIPFKAQPQRLHLNPESPARQPPSIYAPSPVKGGFPLLDHVGRGPYSNGINTVAASLAAAAPQSVISMDSLTESARRRLDEAVDDLDSPRAMDSDLLLSGGQSVMNSSKKRAARSSLQDKNAKGLRHFALAGKFAKKVEEKGTTSYNEVADELVAEVLSPDNMMHDDKSQPCDEKNIRRRVYDALNVMMAINVITREKKEIQWKGLPVTMSESDLSELKDRKAKAEQKISRMKAYLQELTAQYTALQCLIDRNQRNEDEGKASEGISLPFILVQTQPQAIVKVEMSECRQVINCDFSRYEHH
eukprot:jgi/Chlat1/2996/Chrsp2S04649